MPRANRHFLPDHVWHLTHHCHQEAFLLKFAAGPTPVPATVEQDLAGIVVLPQLVRYDASPPVPPFTIPTVTS
jgi:hypothetical protein